MSDKSDALAGLLEADVNVPDLAATTFETLAQNLPYQVHDRVHQENDKQSDTEHDESAAQSETTKQELNRNFARTIKLFEEDREPRVQRAVDVMFSQMQCDVFTNA
jgi:hypothetical protein